MFFSRLENPYKPAEPTLPICSPPPNPLLSNDKRASTLKVKRLILLVVVGLIFGTLLVSGTSRGMINRIEENGSEKKPLNKGSGLSHREDKEEKNNNYYNNGKKKSWTMKPGPTWGSKGLKGEQTPGETKGGVPGSPGRAPDPKREPVREDVKKPTMPDRKPKDPAPKQPNEAVKNTARGEDSKKPQGNEPASAQQPMHTKLLRKVRHCKQEQLPSCPTQGPPPTTTTTRQRIESSSWLYSSLCARFGELCPPFIFTYKSNYDTLTNACAPHHYDVTYR